MVAKIRVVMVIHSKYLLRNVKDLNTQKQTTGSKLVIKLCCMVICTVISCFSLVVIALN